MKTRLSNISAAIIAIVFLSSCGQGTGTNTSEAQVAEQIPVSANTLDPIFTQNPATRRFPHKVLHR